MTDPIQFTVTPRQMRRFGRHVIKRGKVPFIQGSPAIGKSALTHLISDDENLQLIDHRLSTSAPEDLSGLPYFKDDKARFAPFEIFPTIDTPLPEGKSGWLLFL